jgi:hypothetical protein
MGGDVQSGDDDLYLSVGSDDVRDVVSTLLADRRHRGVEWTSHFLNQIDVEDSHLHNDVHDLVLSINVMYQVFDLISEQGSGGPGDIVVPRPYLC